MTTEAEFHALSYHEQAERIEALGREALCEFGVEPASVTLLTHLENTTFRVESPEGRFCLRVSRPGYQFEQNVWSEVQWLAALRQAGFPVPEPYQERLVVAGAAGVPERRTCVLFRWLDGEFRREGLSEEDARKVGRLMAELHEFVQHWERPEGFDRQNQHAWADREGGGPFDKPSPVVSEEDRAYLQNVWQRSAELVRSLPRTPETFGLMHADLHAHNVLFTDDRVGAIDFDDASFGFLVYDFAAALAYEKGVGTREAMLRGYEEVCPLPPGARDLLSPFIRMRLMNVSGWLVERTDNPKLQEDAKSWIPWMVAKIRVLE